MKKILKLKIIAYRHPAIQQLEKIRIELGLDYTANKSAEELLKTIFNQRKGKTSPVPIKWHLREDSGCPSSDSSAENSPRFSPCIHPTSSSNVLPVPTNPYEQLY